jgi:hypothetical protein
MISMFPVRSRLGALAIAGVLATACSCNDGNGKADATSDAAGADDADGSQGSAMDSSGMLDASEVADGAETDAAADSGPADSGPRVDAGCTVDQPAFGADRGVVAQGCFTGYVCNVLNGTCSDGRTCENDSQCDVCSALQNPADCGHGLSLVAVCDYGHSNGHAEAVCTRSRAPCEPCNDAQDCGRMHPSLGVSAAIECIQYPTGKFCGRPCSGVADCPSGYSCDPQLMQCKTDTCPRIVYCDDIGDCPNEAPICDASTHVCVQ